MVCTLASWSYLNIKVGVPTLPTLFCLFPLFFLSEVVSLKITASSSELASLPLSELSPYRNNKVVTRLTQGCDKLIILVVTTLWPGCYNLAKTLDLKLFLPCHNHVTTLFQPCLEVVFYHAGTITMQLLHSVLTMCWQLNDQAKYFSTTNKCVDNLMMSNCMFHGSFSSSFA